MTAPAWFWPPSGKTARAVSIVPFGSSGLAVADWTQATLWPFSGSAFGSPSTLSGTVHYGYAGAAPDASGGVWGVSQDGFLLHTISGGTVSYTYLLPSGHAYVGAAFINGSGAAVTSSGTVYAPGSTVIGTFPAPVRSLVYSGSTMAAMMAASGVGVMSSVGATGLIAFPAAITAPTCLAVASGAQLVLGGTSPMAPLNAAVAAALDPQDTTRMLAVGSGFAVQWTAPNAYADAWATVQVVTGLASLVGVTWRPDGTQALAPSLASGAVQVLGYAAGSVSLVQTLTVSGAVSVAIAGDSAHALVAQSGLSQVMPITYGANWATGTAIAGLAGIAAVAAYGDSSAVAAVTAGLQYLNLSAGSWSSGSSVSLPFAPTKLAVDRFGVVYAAGGTSYAVASGTTLLGSGTWAASGTLGAIAVQQGRFIIADTSGSVLRVLGQSSASGWTQQASATLATGTPIGLALSSTLLFVMAPSGTATYGFSGAPFALTPTLSGAVGFWNGSAWTSAHLGVGHIPASIGIDASGGAWVATDQNTLWHLSSGATTLSSGALSQYTGQAQTTPLVPSALAVASGAVYVATGLPGVLIEAA